MLEEVEALRSCWTACCWARKRRTRAEGVVERGRTEVVCCWSLVNGEQGQAALRRSMGWRAPEDRLTPARSIVVAVELSIVYMVVYVDGVDV